MWNFKCISSCIYTAYKRLTSEVRTPTDWNWGDGKRYTIENRVAALTSDKADFKPKIRDKEGHYMIKESLHQEDITTINTCALNIGTPKYINQA